MKSQESIKQEIAAILKELHANTGPSRMGCLVLFSIVAVFVVTAALASETELIPSSWRQVALLVVGAVFVLVVCVGPVIVFEAPAWRAAEEASSEYNAKFPPGTPERAAADRLLANLEDPYSDQLRTAVGVETEKEVQRKRQKRAVKRAARAFDITCGFECSACGGTVNVERLGQTLYCGKCGQRLQMPPRIACPSCAGSVVGIVPPKEQAKSGTQFKWAGALLYGPAGWIVGSVVDGVKDGVSGAEKRSLKSSKCECKTCGHTWTIKLPALGN